MIFHSFYYPNQGPKSQALIFFHAHFEATKHNFSRAFLQKMSLQIVNVTQQFYTPIIGKNFKLFDTQIPDFHWFNRKLNGRFQQV